MSEKQPPRGRGRARRGPAIQVVPLPADSTSSDEGISSQPATQPPRAGATSTSSSSGPSGGRPRASSRGPGRSRGPGARGASRGRGRVAALVKNTADDKKDEEEATAVASSNSQLIPQTNTKSSTSDEQAGDRRRGIIPQDHHVDLARRPGYGTKSGANFEVACNYYKCKGSPPKSIYLYRIRSELTEERDGARAPILDYERSMHFFDTFQKVFFEQSSSSSSDSLESASSEDVNRKTGPVAYYDGKTLFYSTVDNMAQIQENVTYDVEYPSCRSMRDRELPFQCTVTKLKVMSDIVELYRQRPGQQMDPILMQYFEVLLKHSLYRKDYTRVGTSFYMLNQNIRPLNCVIPAKEVFTGFHLQMKHISTGLAVQVKDKCGVFYKSMPLHQFLCDYWNSEDPLYAQFWKDSYNLVESNKLVKKLKVNIVSKTGSNGRTKVIKELTASSAADLCFQDQSGRKMNVADYFIRKGERLEFPQLPCVSTGKKDHPEYYPMECCHIVARQPVKGLLDPNAISALIRVAAKPATETFNAIRENMMTATQAIAQDMQNIDMSVDRSMVKTAGRMIEAPAMQYGDGKQHPNNGTWHPRSFITPKKIKNWGACIVSRRGQRDGYRTVRRAVDTLYTAGQKVGMEINFLAFESMPNVIQPHQLDEFLGFCSTNKLELVLVVLDGRNTEEYAQAKFLAERKYPGLLTQCAQMKTIQRMNEQSAIMLLMKINAKLNGQNAECDLTLANPTGGVLFTDDHPVLVQGLEMSVLPGQESLVGMASSYDQNASMYTMISRMTNSSSHCLELYNMEVEAIKTYYKMTGRKPKSIIFFRPGVNEHQISSTAGYECTQIRKACEALEDDYSPKITYIMATKMHATRFCATDKRFQVGKSQNVPAGTVVDTDIVDVEKWDFYLASSQGIQGTSIPTKYTICVDDNKLTADSAEALCYYLCHGFVRCNRAISLPNCMKYAKLAAERGRNHLKGGAYAINRDCMNEAKKQEILNLKYLVKCSAGAEEKQIVNPLYRRMFFT